MSNVTVTHPQVVPALSIAVGGRPLIEIMSPDADGDSYWRSPARNVHFTVDELRIIANALVSHVNCLEKNQ
jgi:hypothetical protein